MKFILMFALISLISVSLGVQFGEVACGLSWIIGLSVLFLEERLELSKDKRDLSCQH